MTFEEIQQRLAAKFGERIGPLAPANKDAFLVVKPSDLVEICRFLKDDPDLAFDCLMNLSAVDWPKKPDRDGQLQSQDARTARNPVAPRPGGDVLPWGRKSFRHMAGFSAEFAARTAAVQRTSPPIHASPPRHTSGRGPAIVGVDVDAAGGSCRKGTASPRPAHRHGLGRQRQRPLHGEGRSVEDLICADGNRAVAIDGQNRLREGPHRTVGPGCGRLLQGGDVDAAGRGVVEVQRGGRRRSSRSCGWTAALCAFRKVVPSKM